MVVVVRGMRKQTHRLTTMISRSTRPPANNRGAPLALKVSAGYGRLYITGPAHRVALRLPGAALNERRSAVEVSLTLDSLRGLRNQLRISPEKLASFCTEEVLAWARAAGKVERHAKELHKKFEEGWRMEFDWQDARTGTPAYEPRTEQDFKLIEKVDGQWVWKYRPPFDHQKIMTTFAVCMNGCAFVADMGTAKTRASIEAIRYQIFNHHFDVAVVVCPKSVMKTWKDQITNWAPDLRFEVLAGTINERRRVIQSWAATPLAPRVLILNYDVLHHLKDDIERLFGRVKGAFCPDEMHRLRNANTKVSKSAMSITQTCKWRNGLTGTPVLQGIQDVWAQWFVVDLGLTFGSNFVQYRREFIDENSYTMKLEPKPGALDRVGQKMRLYGLRFTKDECLDLPPKIWETALVEMTREQAVAYAQMETELVARLKREDDEAFATAANQLVAILRLTQITSGFVPDEFGTIHRFRPNPKLDELEELVREQITSQQIIVWARYTEDICAICERLNDLRPVVIAGEQALPKIRQRGIQVPTREQAEDWFQNGSRPLLVGNPSAGGLGLNLWRGSLVAYYSQGYSLEHRLQSEDRSHRSGSEIHDKVTYVDLIAANSIDGVVRDALLSKKTVAEAVVDLRRFLGVD